MVRGEIPRRSPNASFVIRIASWRRHADRPVQLPTTSTLLLPCSFRSGLAGGGRGVVAAGACLAAFGFLVSPRCLARRLLAFRCRGSVLLPRPREALTRRHGQSSDASSCALWRWLPPSRSSARTARLPPPTSAPGAALVRRPAESHRGPGRSLPVSGGLRERRGLA